MARTLDRDEFLRIVTLFLEELATANARSRCVVHSGAVGWGGKAILIPGPSKAGKSTLVEALLRAGASYLSDELAVLDRRGRAHPYARPLRRRTEDGRIEALAPEEVGGSWERSPLPVGLVVVTRYTRGARWKALPISSARGALSLLQNCISARMWSANALDIARQTCAPAIVIHARRGEADDAARRIIALCERAWERNAS